MGEFHWKTGRAGVCGSAWSRNCWCSSVTGNIFFFHLSKLVVVLHWRRVRRAGGDGCRRGGAEVALLETECSSGAERHAAALGSGFFLNLSGSFCGVMEMVVMSCGWEAGMYPRRQGRVGALRGTARVWPAFSSSPPHPKWKQRSPPASRLGKNDIMRSLCASGSAETEKANRLC